MAEMKVMMVLQKDPRRAGLMGLLVQQGLEIK